MASCILLLDNYWELEDTKLYSNSLKMQGNKFYAELRKTMTPLENMLHSTGEIKEAGDYSDMLENVVGKVAKMEVKDLAILQVFMDQLERGEVLDVNPEEYEKLKNSKS